MKRAGKYKSLVWTIGRVHISESRMDTIHLFERQCNALDIMHYSAWGSQP